VRFGTQRRSRLPLRAGPAGPAAGKSLHVKVPLTGGAGFIGRAVHDQLELSGHIIRVFDSALDARDNIVDHDRLVAAAARHPLRGGGVDLH
jgi:nucleoside-diphosphate-sugar epimerase